MTEQDQNPALTLDATGLYCPEPVMMLHSKIREIAGGQLLEVLATDPSTQRDVPRFCQFLEHELVAQEEADGQYRYLIRKKKDK
jgi:tRNA 2-thiouridine synthesizing protein A